MNLQPRIESDINCFIEVQVEISLMAEKGFYEQKEIKYGHLII